eukprot:CAMPEP_0185257174 /NCGR_PEP_ID=MMETSP1359-20130426/6240_1 /TAXON_ID=552665 /ORGANISM="Bigelowiella longifila, Strain CCMP242" /LENGTH=286 /DNA_ID=CAMNT_0027842135 /DNA_START=279 /DNA_END=1139 /DNA_ORIENTATION=+
MNTNLSIEEVERPLRIHEKCIVFLSIALFTLWPAVNLYVTFAEETTFWIYAVGSIGLAYSFIQTFYMCGIWIWQNWAMAKVLSHYLNGCYCKQGDKGIYLPNGNTLLVLLETCSVISNDWMVNHQVRCLCTVAIGTAHMGLCLTVLTNDIIPPAMKVFAAWMLLIAIVSYVIVVVTSFVPGYYMDNFFDGVQNYIANCAEGIMIHNRKELIALEHKRNNINCEVPTKIDPLKLEATLFMQRLEHLRGLRGISFAGFFMTKSNSLTVASVVGYIIFSITLSLYPMKY